MIKPPRPSNNVATEPITLAMARLHLRLDTEGSPPSHPDDTLVEALIVAAREAAEGYTGLAIAYQSYTLALDEFPDAAIVLGKWPINSIASITYKDADNATQTLSSTNYFLGNNELWVHFNSSFPSRPPTYRRKASRTSDVP